MCWCWPFSGKPPPPKKKKSRPRSSESRSEKHAYDSLNAEPVVVAYPAQEPLIPKEPRRSRETRTREPRTPQEAKPPQEIRRVREPKPPRQAPKSPEKRAVRETPRPRDARRPTVQLQVPDRWSRPVELVDSASSSTEMLLNPRPDRSRQHRQRHSRSSTNTLRGRGAKRDPPSSSKSKKSAKPETKKSQWTRIPSPPKSTPRRDAPAQSQQRSPRQHHSSRSSRSRTPNTTARRVPDRRFAVLAATNEALEDIRREAFTYPSPPPRTHRVQRYQGVAIETTAIPFHWDCISNSYQPTVSEASRSTGTRHRRRR
ncbi:uncharacterized protein BDZ99DRAFT_190247 [Mytilinidion resinicola]|uniref:Uncharacterized protein n=1 Tax=Mytilinidion resinicola TaxID=574789 RepID=A0A6A6Z1V4_9PEZI|nr:uncharacterized protein BDZ99DRAFT_190247 [Mytilinidion resinicola]KAF2815081.1 hypothetical protein BDZ99DRAFT_190247 [Mytilinidion resinicola]